MWKRKIMEVSEGLSSDVYNNFAKRLLEDKNNLDSFLFGNYDISILATAAPQYYSFQVAEMLGFDTCLATNKPNGMKEWKENIRVEKLNRVIEYLKEMKLSDTVNTLLTDHIDDLPLMEISEEVVLVNPEEHTLKLIKKTSIEHTVLKI